MKYLTLVGLLVSFSALACPELVGEYQCQRSNETISRSIEAIPGGFRVMRDANTVDYITDGNTVQTLPDTDSMRDGQFTSRCTAKQMIVDFKATLMYEGAVVGKQTSKTTYEFQNEKLLITQETKVKKGPFPSVKLPTVKEVCTLK